MLYVTRRVLLGGLGAALAGCKLYRDKPPPVVLGGTVVSPDASIMKALRASALHARLVAALDETGVSKILEENEPLTLFAPTDEAFTKLDAELAPQQETADALKQILLNNIIPARLTKEELSLTFLEMNGSTKVLALNNEVVQISGEDGVLILQDMRERSMNVVTPDAIAANGIIHMTDGVLLPKADTPG